MIDRHAVQALLQSGMPTEQVARQMGVSRRTVQRIAKEPAVSAEGETEYRRQRRIGRPPVPEAVHARVRELLRADLHAPRLEILRQLREEGVRLGESAFYQIYRTER